MSTLAELTTAMTTDEARTAIYDALAARGVDVTAWKSGSVTRTIVAGVAVLLSAFSELQANLARMGFLDEADGEWLRQVAHYVYGVTKDDGTFATGSVDCTNASGNTYTGVADDLVFLSTATGKTYRNTSAFSIGPSATTAVEVRAVEIGDDSTAAATEIDDLVTPLLGVTVSNPLAIVGTNEESDAQLRLRCRESIGRLSPNGPRDAYAYFAKSAVRAVDGSSIGVTRVRTVPDGLGNVDVYCATASAGITGTEGDPSTDLGAVALAIWENVEPIAVTAILHTATIVTQAVTYELWVPDDIGMTSAEVESAVETALSTRLAETPIGGEVIVDGDPGYVFVSAIEATIARALPSPPIRVLVTVPAADVSLTASQAPAVGLVTATAIHFVSRYAIS